MRIIKIVFIILLILISSYPSFAYQVLEPWCKFCDEISIKDVSGLCYDKDKAILKYTLKNIGLCQANSKIIMYNKQKEVIQFFINQVLPNAGEEKSYDIGIGSWKIDLEDIELVKVVFYTMNQVQLDPSYEEDGCVGVEEIIFDRILDCNNKNTILSSIPPIKEQEDITNLSTKKDYSKFLIYSIILIILSIVIYFLLKKRIKVEKGSIERNKKEEIEEFTKESEKIPSNITEAITLKNFSVKHKNNIILDKVDLTIKKGIFVAVIGSSGAGKSTILESIVGRKKYNSGKITIFGKEVGKNNDIYRHVGFVPQNHEIYMNQTVEQNLMTSATKWGIKNAKIKVENILNKINLSNRRDLKASKLSGGQVKLLSTGMELIRDPELLVLDEPTTGLDPNTRNQIITILSNITKNNKTVLITTHFMDDAEECDEVIIVGNKKILAQDSPSKLEKRLPGGDKVVSVVLDNVTDDLLRNIEKISGVERIIREGRTLNILTNDPDTVELAHNIKEVGGVVNEIKITRATMKEVFVFFTNEEIKE